ncbi:MAG: DUF692 domain-containing protein [Nannocystaceae bacterium]|nr:DUF692 domain-containing protein [Nannocystaceae bacterium]
MATPEPPAARQHLGHGVGLRVPHFEQALGPGLDVDLVEAISENFLPGGGRPMAVLQRVRATMPVVLHGVSLAIGSVAPLRHDYLDRLATLIERIEPAWVGDHLCWGAHGHHHSHDLLPLPYTEEAIEHVVQRIDAVQTRLRRALVLENVSSYVGYRHSTMPEWEFLREVVLRSGASILLDVNNVIVSAVNFGFEPQRYVDALPSDRIVQLHLANHADRGHFRFDSHEGPVPEAVWQLHAHVVRRHGPITTIVEWDNGLGSWTQLREQADRARANEAAALAHGSATP